MPFPEYPVPPGQPNQRQSRTRPNRCVVVAIPDETQSGRLPEQTPRTSPQSRTSRPLAGRRGDGRPHERRFASESVVRSFHFGYRLDLHGDVERQLCSYRAGAGQVRLGYATASSGSAIMQAAYPTEWTIRPNSNDRAGVGLQRPVFEGVELALDRPQLLGRALDLRTVEPLLGPELPRRPDRQRRQDDQRSGEVEVVLLEERRSGAVVENRFSSPHGGQNGQNSGAKNSIVMNAIQMSDVQPTSL